VRFHLFEFGIFVLTSLLFVHKGDFWEVPESCPALTTCPTICAATLEDCPTTCQDSPHWSNATRLCATGTCENDCSHYDHVLDNPCTCSTLPIACPKVVDYYDQCLVAYKAFYDKTTECSVSESQSTPHVSLTGPYFLACYLWISAVTLSAVGWCYCNEKMFPRYDVTTMRMKGAKGKRKGSESKKEAWLQTGYKRNIFGTAIYVSVVVTMVGIQILLFVFTVDYYNTQESISTWPSIIPDTQQLLAVYVAVWMIGFPWTICFQFIPSGIETLFLRRCPIPCATHIVVCAPTKQVRRTNSGYIGFGSKIARYIWSSMAAAEQILFSYPYSLSGDDATFCVVEVDPVSSRRFIVHRARRYVFDEKTGGYIPGYVRAGKRIGDFSDQVNGLTSQEAHLRREIVGPNKAIMIKKTFFSALLSEFSKPYYVYQNFILWPWFLFYIHWLGVMMTLVRFAGGVLSAYFLLLSESALYKLSQVNGEVK
jgi:hypothetical protein